MKFTNFFKGFFAAALLLTANAAGAYAQASESRPIGTFGDWSAHTFMEDGNKVCYMATQPIKAEGNYTQRGEIFVLMTHRPAEGSRNVFSYIAGYTYKPDSEVTVTIDGNRFSLFTQDDTAWTPDAATDNKLADAIRKGSRMVVRGTSARGTATSDTFSLKGSSKAHEAISRECGL